MLARAGSGEGGAGRGSHGQESRARGKAQVSWPGHGKVEGATGKVPRTVTRAPCTGSSRWGTPICPQVFLLQVPLPGEAAATLPRF